MLLGGNHLNVGIADWLHDRFGALVVVDRAEKLADSFGHLERLLHVSADYTDTSIIVPQIKAFSPVSPGVITSSDEAVPAASIINKQFGREHVDEVTARNLLSKTWMLKAWAQAGIRVPKTSTIHRSELVKVGTRRGGLVVKPDRSSGSRGVSICTSQPSSRWIADAQTRAALVSLNDYIQVQEFIDGVEFTVELIADAAGTVCPLAVSKKSHSPYVTSGRVSTILHYNPAELPQPMMDSIMDFGSNCMEALNLRATLGHLELIMTPDGDMVPLEIGARSSGFIASHLVSAVTGRGYLGDYFDILSGGSAPSRPMDSNRSAAYLFVDVPPGTAIQGIRNLTDLIPAELVILKESISTVAAQVAPRLSEDAGRIGYILLAGPKQALTGPILSEIQSTIGGAMQVDAESSLTAPARNADACSDL